MQLQIDAVHQPQRAEFVLGQRTVQTALHLTAELLGPVAQVFVVLGAGVKHG